METSLSERRSTGRTTTSPWATAATELATLGPAAQLVGGVAAVAITLVLGVVGGPIAAIAGLVALVLVAECGAMARGVKAAQRAAHEQRQGTEQVLSVIERCNDAFVAMDTAGRVRAWNARAETMFGVSRQEAIGQELAQIIVPPRQREAHRNALDRYLSSAEGPALSTRIELTAWRRAEEEFAVELALWPVRTAEVQYFNAFIRDLSRRRQLEQERAELASTLRLMLEESSEGILEVDLDGRCSFLNPSAAAVLGVDAKLAVGLDACSLVHRGAGPEHHNDSSCLIRRALQWGERLRADDEELWRPDGHTLRAEFRTYPTVLDGHMEGLIVAFTPKVLLAPSTMVSSLLPAGFGWG